VRDIKVPFALQGTSASECHAQSGLISVKRQGWNQVTGLTEREHIKNVSKSSLNWKSSTDPPAASL